MRRVSPGEPRRRNFPDSGRIRAWMRAHLNGQSHPSILSRKMFQTIHTKEIWQSEII